MCKVMGWGWESGGRDLVLPPLIALTVFNLTQLSVCVVGKMFLMP